MTRDTFGRFVRSLTRFKPAYLYGYGQSMYRLAQYVVDERIDLSPLRIKAVIVTAERVSAAQRKVIGEAFHARVVNEYGCTEAGVIAMECPLGNMHLMEDSLLVEVETKGRPAVAGEQGEILITELYGYATPLIRYKVGDLAIISQDKCRCGRGLRVLEKFTGRVTDIIVCRNGTMIDPDIVEFWLKRRSEMYTAVRQWSVKQVNESKVVITLSTPEAKPLPTVEAYVAERFRAQGDVRTEFRYEEWLEPDSTGKTRLVSSRVDPT